MTAFGTLFLLPAFLGQPVSLYLLFCFVVFACLLAPPLLPVCHVFLLPLCLSGDCIASSPAHVAPFGDHFLLLFSYLFSLPINPTYSSTEKLSAAQIFIDQSGALGKQVEIAKDLYKIKQMQHKQI